MQGRACPSPAHHLANTSRGIKGNGFILAKAGASRGQGAAWEPRGPEAPRSRDRKRPRERRTRTPQPHTPARLRRGRRGVRRAAPAARAPPPTAAEASRVWKMPPPPPPPAPAGRATKGRAPSHCCPPSPIPPQVLAGSTRPPLSPARRWRRLLTRVPRSQGSGSGAAGGPENTGPLGRGGGGVALPPRPGPGSRLRLPRGRLAPSPRLPSGFPSRPPSVGPSCAESSVLCGRRRTLLRARPPPDSSPGSRAAGPRDARLAVPAPPLRRALAPFAGPFRGPGTRGQRTAGQPSPGFNSRRLRPPSGTSGSFAVSRVLETPTPFPRPSPSFPRPFPLLDPTGKPKQLGPRRRKKGSGKRRKGGGGARWRGGAFGGVSRRRSADSPRRARARPGGGRLLEARAWGSGLASRKERPEKFNARKSRPQSTKFYAGGCFSPLETQKFVGWIGNWEWGGLDIRPQEEGETLGDWLSGLCLRPCSPNAPSTFRACSVFPISSREASCPSFKAKENLKATPERAHSSGEEAVYRVRGWGGSRIRRLQIGLCCNAAATCYPAPRKFQRSAF